MSLFTVIFCIRYNEKTMSEDFTKEENPGCLLEWHETLVFLDKYGSKVNVFHSTSGKFIFLESGEAKTLELPMRKWVTI